MKCHRIRAGRLTVWLLSALLVLAGPVTQAQQVDAKVLKKHQKKIAESAKKGRAVLSLDTVFVNGSPYAVMRTAGKSLWVNDYALFGLDGSALMEIDYECTGGNAQCYYGYTFLQTGARAEVPYKESTTPHRLIADFDLVAGNAIPPARENRFLNRYPPKFTNPPQQTVVNINIGGNAVYSTVERNRKAMLQTIGKEIKQDFKVIGTYDSKTVAVDGRILAVISIYLPDGTKIAEATQQPSGANTYDVVTFKDNKKHEVEVQFTTRAAEDIARYLSDKYYL